MIRHSRHLTSLIGTMLVGIAIWLLASELPLQDAGLAFQSVIPTPRDPHFVPSNSGGRIWCGLQQSSVWLEIPIGFTSEGGAAFYCDAVDSFSQWIGTPGAWEDRAYLVAFYATGVPTLKPVDLVFEVDPVQVGMICSASFSARYYDARIGQWQKLPTHYDVDNARIHAAFDRFLPTARYPAYEDRFLIALFTEDEATSTPIPTTSATAAASRTAALSPLPVPTATRTPSPFPSTTVSTTSPIPFPTPPTTVATASPTPFATPPTTVSPASPTPFPFPSTTVAPISPTPFPFPSIPSVATSPLPAPSRTPPLPTATRSPWLLVVLPLFAVVLVCVILFVVFGKGRKL